MRNVSCMKIESAGQELKITFPYNATLVALVKHLPARRYDPRVRAWFIPIVGSLEHVEKLARRGFLIDPKAYASMRSAEVDRIELEALADKEETGFDTTLPLFPYQRVGSKFLWRAGSGLLADEVGLGKTIQSLAVIERTKTYPVLVFCPAILKYQWEQEIKRFLPAASTTVIDGNALEREKRWKEASDIKIANYELLQRDFDAISRVKWGMIVADEATRIANPFTKTYKTITKLNAAHRIALTGTPISNRPDELWGIINWCMPGVLGSYYSFVERYCVKNMWGGIYRYQHLEELQKRIKRFMIRRRKEDVLPELPEKIVSDVPFLLSEKEWELYQKIRKELLHEILKEDISKLENPITIQNTLTKMLRLRQIANSLELVGEKTDSSKLEALREVLSEVVAEDRKVIVFTFFSGMADILERELKEYHPLKITGDVTNSARQIVIDDFNFKDEHKVLVMTSAGQYGLNIQAASCVIHYDQEWSLAKMEQREGRSHRLGQQRSVLVYNLLAKGTIDEYVRKILRTKQQLARDLLGDGIGAEEIKGMLNYGDA